MSIRALVTLVAVSCFLAQQVSAQVPKRYEVVGPVRSLRQETAKLTDIGGKTVEGPRVLIMTATYDIHGNTTDRVVNNPDGTLKWRVSWAGRSTLDAQGRETERVTFNTNGEVTRRTAYEYDSNGKVTKTITYDMGKLTLYDTFEYAENGRKIRADYFNSDGSSRGTDTFAYDILGYPSEIIHSEGIVQHRDCYKYDDRGNETEWSVYDKDGNRGLKASWGYSVDSRGVPTTFLRYDSNDNLLSKETYTYEFDSHGNWIKSKTRREVFAGHAPIIETETTYRTITYRQSE